MSSSFKSVVLSYADGTSSATSVNGRLSDDEIAAYFVGQFFNCGLHDDDMRRCISITIDGLNVG